MIWSKLLIVPLTLILSLALASPGVRPTIMEFLPQSEPSLSKRYTYDTTNIPRACLLACPTSFLKHLSRCSGYKSEVSVEKCLCRNGSDFLDQWDKCDLCLETLYVDTGETYVSFKPDCSSVENSAGEQILETSVGVANANIYRFDNGKPNGPAVRRYYCSNPSGG